VHILLALRVHQVWHLDDGTRANRSTLKEWIPPPALRLPSTWPAEPCQEGDWIYDEELHEEVNRILDEDVPVSALSVALKTGLDLHDAEGSSLGGVSIKAQQEDSMPRDAETMDEQWMEEDEEIPEMEETLGGVEEEAGSGNTAMPSSIRSCQDSSFASMPVAMMFLCFTRVCRRGDEPAVELPWTVRGMSEMEFLQLASFPICRFTCIHATS
jgi:hypothetical protein